MAIKPCAYSNNWQWLTTDIAVWSAPVNHVSVQPLSRSQQVTVIWSLSAIGRTQYLGHASSHFFTVVNGWEYCTIQCQLFFIKSFACWRAIRSTSCMIMYGLVLLLFGSSGKKAKELSNILLGQAGWLSLGKVQSLICFTTSDVSCAYISKKIVQIIDLKWSDHS